MHPMRIPIHLVLLFVLVAISAVYDCKKISSGSYVFLPTNFDTKFHKDIKAALKEIEIDPLWKIDPFPFEFLRAIQLARINARVNPTYHEVYTTLEDTFYHTESRSKRMIDVFKSIYAQTHLDPNSGLELWKPFVRITAIRFFPDAYELMYREDRWKIDAEALVRLDKVFEPAFSPEVKDERLTTSKLAERLTQFDPTRGKIFDAKKMVKKLRQITGDKTIKDNFALLKKFMLGQCKQLMADGDLWMLITAADMARYLNRKLKDWSAYPYGTRFHTLTRVDEYNRLCGALEAPETKKRIEDNLKDQLECKKPSCF